MVFRSSGDGESQCPLEAGSLSGTLNLSPFCGETTEKQMDINQKLVLQMIKEAKILLSNKVEELMKDEKIVSILEKLEKSSNLLYSDISSDESISYYLDKLMLAVKEQKQNVQNIQFLFKRFREILQTDSRDCSPRFTLKAQHFGFFNRR